MMDALKSRIEQQLKDENEDQKMYLELADKVEEGGDDNYAGILRDIAHDEHTHAKALEHILDHIK